MSRSVEEIVANLEAQVAFHQEQEGLHAQKEEEHRSARARHAAALEEAARRLEAFRAASAEAVELVARFVPAPQEPVELTPRERTPGRLAVRVIRELGPEESFGASRIAREIARKFGPALRKPVDSRLVAVALARMARRGRLVQVRRGRPHWESLYTRARPAGPA